MLFFRIFNSSPASNFYIFRAKLISSFPGYLLLDETGGIFLQDSVCCRAEPQVTFMVPSKHGREKCLRLGWLNPVFRKKRRPPPRRARPKHRPPFLGFACRSTKVQRAGCPEEGAGFPPPKKRFGSLSPGEAARRRRGLRTASGGNGTPRQPSPPPAGHPSGAELQLTHTSSPPRPSPSHWSLVCTRQKAADGQKKKKQKEASSLSLLVGLLQRTSVPVVPIQKPLHF